MLSDVHLGLLTNSTTQQLPYSFVPLCCLCRASEHFHLLRHFLNEPECVSEEEQSSAETARCPDRLASVSSAVCSLWLVSCPLAAAIGCYHEPSLSFAQASLSLVMWFSLHDRQLMLDLLECCLCLLPAMGAASSAGLLWSGRRFISLLCSML